MSIISHFWEYLPLLDETDIEDLLIIEESNKKLPIPRIQKFEFNSFVDEYCYLNFRFHKDDILRLKRCLNMQGTYTCENGVKVSTFEALCITLRRLAYPNR
jgi:hypothetical protein